MATCPLMFAPVAALLILAEAAPASAHAFLDAAEPAVGGTVAAAPTEVRLRFTEALEPAFSSIIVEDAQGQHVEKGKAKLDPNDPKRLAVSLNPLPPGTYKVVWRVISVDTHPTQGDFTFTVRP